MHTRLGIVWVEHVFFGRDWVSSVGAILAANIPPFVAMSAKKRWFELWTTQFWGAQIWGWRLTQIIVWRWLSVLYRFASKLNPQMGAGRLAWTRGLLAHAALQGVPATRGFYGVFGKPNHKQFPLSETFRIRQELATHRIILLVSAANDEEHTHHSLIPTYLLCICYIYI